MVEKVSQVGNPLTVVAIFAALAEIAGTVALDLVSPGLQGIFVWFVMLFPTLIVVLFFMTLNFNPRVLYAPSDFSNEEHFIKTLVDQQSSGSDSKVEVNRDNLEEVRDSLKKISKNPDNLHSNKYDSNTIDTANSLFESLLESSEYLFDNGKLSSIGYKHHSSNFFLLSFELPEEKLNDRAVSDFNFILFIRQIGPSEYVFEAVGENIKTNDKDKFVSMIVDRIEEVADTQISMPDEMPGLRE